MKLADLIDRLIELQNNNFCDETEVTIMQESDTNGFVVQYSSELKDIALCKSYRNGDTEGKVSGIILIGKEYE